MTSFLIGLILGAVLAAAVPVAGGLLAARAGRRDAVAHLLVGLGRLLADKKGGGNAPPP